MSIAQVSVFAYANTIAEYFYGSLCEVVDLERDAEEDM